MEFAYLQLFHFVTWEENSIVSRYPAQKIPSIRRRSQSQMQAGGGAGAGGGEARPTGRSIRLEVPRHPRPGTPLMTFHKPRFDPGCQAACPCLGSLQECPPPPGSGAGRLCSAHPLLP